VQRQAEEIVKARLAEREASRLLGDIEAERKIRAQLEEVRSLDVEVVISRFQGDKKVSSLPYALVVSANRQAKPPTTVLRMGGRVPLPVAPGGPVSYTDVGTQIDCSARIKSEREYELTISVEDSAVAKAGDPVLDNAGLPVIRTFQARNTLVMREGQTRQFTVASDRVTSEVVRIDVTVRAPK
jgi:hypothetical protein